jgi:hypothetical protein
MSDTELDEDLFNYLADTPTVRDADFKSSLDAADAVLGVEGTSIRLLPVGRCQ